MTTTPLNWREHMTEEERVSVSELDDNICFYRSAATDYTYQRELIRRRVTGRTRQRMRKEVKG